MMESVDISMLVLQMDFNIEFLIMDAWKSGRVEEWKSG